MASPVQLLPTYPSDNLFATPNFDEIRESHDNDLAYFDSLDGTGDSFMLDSSNMSGSWDLPAQKQRPAADSVLDPFLLSNPPFGSGPDFNSGEAMFTTHELTPPPSAVEEKGQRVWPVKLERPEASPNKNNNYTENTGQITPPLSSKSPESEHAAEMTTTKRTRKASAKVAAQKSPPAAEAAQSAPPAAAPKGKAPRKARKIKDESDSNVEESQSEGAKAKRARFLERNRQAAYTCRQRKKQWAKDLEGRHRDLERDNQNLKMVVVSLKDEYHYLRQQVVQHSTCECTGAREYIQRASRVLETSADDEPGSEQLRPVPPTLPAAAPELEQALRASLAHFGKPDPSGLDFVHEGAELDGMTL